MPKPYRRSKVEGKLRATHGRLERLLASKLPPDAIEAVQAALGAVTRALKACEKERESD